MKLSPWKLVGLFAAILFTTLHSWTNPLNANKSPAVKLVLTSIENGLMPEDSFSCADTIHGYITLPEPAIGKNQLEADWIAPNGTLQESSHAILEFSPPGRRTAYIWARFSGAGEGFLSSTEDESAPTSFSGTWNVIVRWNDKILVEKSFNLGC